MKDKTEMEKNDTRSPKATIMYTWCKPFCIRINGYQMNLFRKGDKNMQLFVFSFLVLDGKAF